MKQGPNTEPPLNNRATIYSKKQCVKNKTTTALKRAATLAIREMGAKMHLTGAKSSPYMGRETKWSVISLWD